MLSLSGAPALADNAEARALFGQGLSLYRQQHYSEALALFHQAYAQASRPNIALNIAQCYRKLRQPQRALTYYRNYLRQWDKHAPGKPSPYQAEVEQHIAQLERQVHRARSRAAARAQPRTKTVAPPAPKPAKVLQHPQGLGQPAPSSSPALTVATSPPPPSANGPPPLYRRWWFWAAVGAVVAGTATVAIVAAQPGQATVPSGSLPPGTIWLDR